MKSTTQASYSNQHKVSRTPMLMKLKDGRMFSWYEFGDPAGSPCVFLPGVATSGLAGAALESAATTSGIRLISIDRPGLGRSDPEPTRRLKDWADDITQLMDHLHLDRFGVLGHSAGGAYALAVARALPERVVLTVIGSGSGPISEAWFKAKGMQSSISRLYYWLALYAPKLFGGLQSLSTPRSPKAIDRLAALAARGESADAKYATAYPAETRIAMEALADGGRQGSQGATYDIRAICRPWGFDLGEVTSPVEWWHGEQDANVSLLSGKEIVSRLANVASTHFVPGGHYILFSHAGEVMATLKKYM